MKADELREKHGSVGARGERLVKAHIIKATGGDLAENDTRFSLSRSLPSDPFESLADEIVPPPYDIGTLARLPEWSTALASAIEVMEINIHGFGFDLASVFGADPPDELTSAVAKEENRVENGLNVFGQTSSLAKTMRGVLRDREITGNGYLEMIRNPGTGKVVAGKRIKSSRMRLVRQDEKYTEYTLVLPQVVEDGTIEYIKVPHARRFRRYVESTTLSSQSSIASASAASYRYYKEYGDPRVIDNQTGDVVWAPGDAERVLHNFLDTGKEMPDSRKASEIYHFALDTGAGPYGIPRWISALLSVLGARSAENVNFFTLENNGVPSMVVTVSNGQLTAGTLKRIQQYVDNHVKGNSNYSTFLVLEGEGAIEGEDSSQTKISITPLADTQVRDMLFGDYISKNEKRVLQSFRIPPIYVGLVEEYNKSTAEISRKLADEQVFAPERAENDWFFNTVIFAEWGVKYHVFKTNTPTITDNQALIGMATALERTGSMTPRVGREIAKEVFPALSRRLSAFKSEADGGVDPDAPFSLQMAAAVKNMAMPTEVGQQVAPVIPAEKPQDVFTKLLVDIDKAADDELARYMSALRSEE